jgi:hypothetical protein
LVPCLPGASLLSCACRRRVSVAGEGSPPPSTTELQRWFKGQFFYGLRSVPMAFSVSAGCYSPPSSPASPAASAPMWSISGLVLFSFGVCGRMLDLLGVVVLGTRRQCSSKFKGSVSIVRRYGVLRARARRQGAFFGDGQDEAAARFRGAFQVMSLLLAPSRVPPAPVC